MRNETTETLGKLTPLFYTLAMATQSMKYMFSGFPNSELSRMRFEYLDDVEEVKKIYFGRHRRMKLKELFDKYELAKIVEKL